MKKIIITLFSLIGIILIAVGIDMKRKGSYSIGLIGGADGPTAIFVAGKINDGICLGIFIAGILILGIVIYKKWISNKKH